MKTNCDKCGSSDAKHIYEDHEFCFSCNTRFNLNYAGDAADENTEFANTQDAITGIMVNHIIKWTSYSSYPISSRGISKEVVDHFGVRMEVDEDGKPKSHLYPYTKDGQLEGWKERRLPKEFYVHGSINGCLLYTSPSPRDRQKSRMPSSA